MHKHRNVQRGCGRHQAHATALRNSWTDRRYVPVRGSASGTTVRRSLNGMDSRVQHAPKDLTHLPPESSLVSSPPSAPPARSVPAPALRQTLLHEYAARSAAIFKDCQALSSIGIPARLDAPTLVVAGDRGSGKSQVVSQLCGLDVPMTGGLEQLPMRCPLVIQMLGDSQARSAAERKSQAKADTKDHRGPAGSATTGHTATWYQVKLRRTHDVVTGEPLHTTLLTPFGGPVLDPATLNSAILRAQATLLNPSRPMSDFLDYLPLNHDANELHCTPNAVLVEVHHAPMTLTVVDLPGLVPHHEAFAGDAPPHQEDMVRTLRKTTLEFMGTPDAVLLAVVSCASDVAHQEVLDLARRVDASGRRTLGVLTQASQSSAPPHIMGARELLTGKVMPLRLGYVLLNEPPHSFCAGSSQRPGSPGSRDASTAAGGAASPLSLLVQDAQKVTRQGEAVLGHLASGLLLEHLALQMPYIQTQVSERLRHVTARLDSLTPTGRPDELAKHARSQFKAMTRAFDEALRGQSIATAPRSMRFARDIMNNYKDFGRRIVSSRPRFQLATAEVKQRLGNSSASMDHLPHLDPEPILARYGEEDEEGDPLYHPGVTMTTVEDVKKLLAAQRGLELPTSDMRDSAATRAIRTFQSSWRRDAQALLDSVGARLLEETHTQIGHYFGHHPRLADLLKGHCVDLVFTTHQRAKQHLDMLVDMELSPDNPPLTLLDKHFQTLQEVLASSMQDVRARALQLHQPFMNVEDRATKVEAVRQLLHELGTDTSSWTDQQLLDRLGVAAAQEQDGAAIRVMAASMAFFKVSSRRFRDTVPLCVRHQLINGVAAAFEEHLERSLIALASTAGDAWPCMCGVRSRSMSPPPLIEADSQGQLQPSSTAAPASPSSSTSNGSSTAATSSSLDVDATMAQLGWASSPAVLCLLTGGPLDAVRETERQELMTTRDILTVMLKQISTHVHPHHA